jgi:putative membrane protein
MIRSYNEHSANERTFLAWIRTGIAVIAFGFVIEKVDLYVDAFQNSAKASGRHSPSEGLSSLFSQYDGVALIGLGLALIIVQAARFERTRRQIDDDKTHEASSVRVEWGFVALLVMLVVVFVMHVQSGLI